jgi:hypothetical protein
MYKWLIQQYQASHAYELRQRLRGLYKPRPLRSCRSYIHDPVTREIQDQIFMEIYWVAPPVGPGPGASIYIVDDEVMRFDCFGSDLGHYHFNIRQSKFFPNGEKTRIFFPEGTVEKQIENATVQLCRNLDYGRGLNTDPRIRAVKIDQNAVEAAAAWMREQLLEIAGAKRDIEPAAC